MKKSIYLLLFAITVISILEAMEQKSPSSPTIPVKQTAVDKRKSAPLPSSQDISYQIQQFRKNRATSPTANAPQEKEK